MLLELRNLVRTEKVVATGLCTVRFASVSLAFVISETPGHCGKDWK